MDYPSEKSLLRPSSPRRGACDGDPVEPVVLRRTRKGFAVFVKRDGLLAANGLRVKHDDIFLGDYVPDWDGVLKVVPTEEKCRG